MKNLRSARRAAVQVACALLVVGSSGGAVAAEATPAATRLARTRITLRGSDLPLGSVLNQIARSAQLALVADKDVRLDRSIASPNLDDSALDTALAVILSPLGYSYDVDEQKNFLRVFVYETRTFRVAMPMVFQRWKSGVSNQPGDDSTPVFGQTGARIALSTHSETTGLWEEVEKGLGRLLGSDEPGGAGRPGDKDKDKPKDMGSFSVNRVAGFVTVRALPTVMPTIESYFDALNDEMGRSVVVEVKVMQVDVTDTKSASLDWNLLAMRLGDVVFLGGQMGRSLLVPSTAPYLRVSGRAGDAFIRALEEQGKVEMVAQPTLALGNNLPAVIELGQVQGYVAQQTTTIVGGGGAAGFQTTVQTSSLSDGLIISMLPRVLNNGEILLALGAILQDILEIKREDFGQGFVDLPRTSRRSYNGVVRAKLNETLVIGGLITTRKEEGHAGIPFLSRIPVIGWLFGAVKHIDKKSELIITVTPREVKSIIGPAQPVPLKLEPTD
jgi:hypothetical protein